MGITLLGTSHISPKSAQQVREKIASDRFDIIAIELDSQRFSQLMHPSSQRASFFSLIRAVGFSGALFAKIGQFVSQKLGGRIGTEPGIEMKAAIDEAREQKKKIALIDQPILITLQRFSKAFTFREKLRLMTRGMRIQRREFTLSDVPDETLVEDLVSQLERISPALYQVLVEERNVYMVKHLLALEQKYPESTILAIVGAGHVPGMRKSLNIANKSKEI